MWWLLMVGDTERDLALDELMKVEPYNCVCMRAKLDSFCTWLIPGLARELP